MLTASTSPLAVDAGVCSARLDADELGEPVDADAVVVVDAAFDDGLRKILNVERRRESGCLVANFVKFECSFQCCEFLL